jgi:hypothetical protein
MDGMAAIGGQTAYSRGDHVHPSDTSRLPLAGGTLTGPLILAADPVNPLGTATKQYVDAAASASAAHNVGRNLLHNSLFNVQQRGAGPWVASANYTADRWQLSITLDNVSASLTTLNDTTRGQIGDEAATTCWQAIVTGNGGASAFSLLGQPIENVRRLAGKTITVSFWAAASGALKLGVNVLQNFGSGGASSVWATPQTVTLSTIWTRYSATIVIPSAALKTFGTAGTDFSQVSFVFSSGTTNAAVLGNPGVQSGTFQLWGVQLEIGSVATPLEKPDPQQDLAKCQRFFCSVTGGLYVASAGSASQQAFIPVGQAMRAMPTVAGYTSLGATSFPASGSYGVVGGPSGLAIADNRSATTNLAAFFYGTYFLSADL